MQIACGEWDYKPDEFYNLTPFEFEMIRMAKRNKEDRFLTKAIFLVYSAVRAGMATKGGSFDSIRKSLVSQECIIREKLEKEEAFKRDFEKGGNEWQQ